MTDEKLAKLYAEVGRAKKGVAESRKALDVAISNVDKCLREANHIKAGDVLRIADSASYSRELITIKVRRAYPSINSSHTPESLEKTRFSISAVRLLASGKWSNSPKHYYLYYDKIEFLQDPQNAADRKTADAKQKALEKFMKARAEAKSLGIEVEKI